MPRNASGTYSLPSGNPVSSGTLIDANWANNTLNDLANEVTDSLSRSAEGGMLAPLRLTDGVQATPSLAFTNEPSTGLYRAGTNDAWFVSGGNQVMQFTSSGVVGRLAAGAVGTPSLTFFGDLNTGLWSPAADTLAASTGGSERLRVDSSGNLGIGTSSPGARLHSKSSLAENTRIEGTTARGGGNVYASFYDPTGRKGYFGYSGVDDSFNMVNEMNAYMSFGTNGIERMRLDSSGNLGIGTASPTVRFEVSTAGGAVAAGRFYSPSTTNGARLELADNNTNFNLRTIPAGGTTDLSFTRDGTSFEMLRLNYTGSVAAGRPSLATNATDGFLYVPTCAGVPTGVPTAITGMAPIVVNTTNNKLYFYSGGAWRDAGP